MSWGKGIALLYSSFVVFMIGLVYMCVQQKDIFLVSADYYKQELAYQDKIDQTQNTYDLSVEPIIDYTETGLAITFPEECSESSGEVSLYRPSNGDMDISIPFKLSLNNTLNVSTDKLEKGLWVLKLNWSKDTKKYYLEQKITI
ncbi:FixH family protein [uncultured Arcticibacterium sp.]|uniref:FixH family protein n=1 Tax=uncultured Arcticibacterium sp. TaxID=2173042 RepID=UPI0030F859EC